MSQMQKTPTAGTSPESADTMAGNKLAASAAERAQKALDALAVASRNQDRKSVVDRLREAVKRSPRRSKKADSCWC